MSESYEAWGVVEMLGHKMLAGRISEQVIAGCAFVRVDVPETLHSRPVEGFGGAVVESKPGYTKHIGTGSIYCITPCDEETARRAAKEIERWNDPLPVKLPKLLPAGAAVGSTPDDVNADFERDTEAVWEREDEDDED